MTGDQQVETGARRHSLVLKESYPLQSLLEEVWKTRFWQQQFKDSPTAQCTGIRKRLPVWFPLCYIKVPSRKVEERAISSRGHSRRSVGGI